jgi:DNA-binding MurR/RpiR family transcriptional regulator
MYQQRIREMYEQFSPGYRRVADFVLNRYRDAAFMTAAQVGAASRVDAALVVRFAQRLGYPGFPELLAEIQDDVKRDLRAVYETGIEGDTAPALLRRNLLQDRNNLDYMLLHIDEEVVETVIAILLKRPQIWVTGEGNGALLAEAFVTRLSTLGFDAHPVPNAIVGQAAEMANLHQGDVFIGLAMTALTPGVSVLLKLARQQGACTIAIVPTASNPVAGVAEYVLYAPTVTAGVMPSWTAIAALLHALSQTLAVRLGNFASTWVMNTDRLLQLYADSFRQQIPRIESALTEYQARPVVDASVHEQKD